MEKFWSFIEKTDPVVDMETLDKIIRKKYNVELTYIGSSLHVCDHLLLTSNTNIDNLNFIHNEENISLIFPEYAVRIACTKKFIDNIPYVKQILSEQWSEKIIQDTYYCPILKETIHSSKIIIIRTNMEAILYDHPIKIKIKDYTQKNHYNIVEKTCKSLEDSVILLNTNQYEDNEFAIDLY